MLPVLSLGIKVVSVAVKVIKIEILVPEIKTHGISVNKLVASKYVQLFLSAYLTSALNKKTTEELLLHVVLCPPHVSGIPIHYVCINFGHFLLLKISK